VDRILQDGDDYFCGRLQGGENIHIMFYYPQGQFRLTRIKAEFSPSYKYVHTCISFSVRLPTHTSSRLARPARIFVFITDNRPTEDNSVFRKTIHSKSSLFQSQNKAKVDEPEKGLAEEKNYENGGKKTMKLHGQLEGEVPVTIFSIEQPPMELPAVPPQPGRGNAKAVGPQVRNIYEARYDPPQVGRYVIISMYTQSKRYQRK
jgi:hypothetical protein